MREMEKTARDLTQNGQPGPGPAPCENAGAPCCLIVGGTSLFGQYLSALLVQKGQRVAATKLPTERADNNDFQWYRNGAQIPGATGSSWRISGGGKIKLCVRYGRFGFHTAAWACSSAKKV